MDITSVSNRSEYYFQLEKAGKIRYEEKLIEMDILRDPFLMKPDEFNYTNDFERWPDIAYTDIFAYLINYPSIYTKKQLKAYKSLESYKYVVSGLVFDVLVKTVNSNFLVKGKVRHGQSMFSKPPNNSWVFIQSDGEISFGHCSCMAGLGEVCSHVGAILFYLLFVSEYFKRKSDNACTSQPCAWLPPTIKNVEYAELSKIDFRDSKRRLIPKLCDEEKSNLETSECLKTTHGEQEHFYSKLEQANISSAILRIIPGFCDKYVPTTEFLRTSLFDFYDKKYEKLLYHELIIECKKLFDKISIAPEEIPLIEAKTREQSRSELWFQARSGVITASKFRACCFTDISQPSKSLIMTVCYPSKYRFSTKATEYGCNFEKEALATLYTVLCEIHNDGKLIETGLFRSEKYPYLGATPDGMFECSCCTSKYVIEIKCPYNALTTPLEELAKNDRKFCMEVENNAYRLKRNHAYFYQVQLQMLLTETNACYFFVYSKSSYLYELVFYDQAFLKEKLPDVELFFKYAILPELLGKWYSRSHITPAEIFDEAKNENICTCQTQRDSQVITCCDKSCVVKTYHLTCLGLVAKPNKKWYCPYCARKKSRGKK